MEWIEHRRADDRERVGWMAPEGEGFVAIDLLGRRRSEAVDWAAAEEVLDELGIGYLADAYELRLDDGSWVRVRITEATPATVRVKKDDFGDMTATQHFYSLPFPVPEDRLRPLHR